MEDRIELFGPFSGELVGHLVWQRGRHTKEGGYFYSDENNFTLSENILLYIAGQIRTLNAARRRQNQK